MSALPHQRTLRAALEHLQAGRAENAAKLARPLAAQDTTAALLLGLALGLQGDVASAAPLLAKVAAARPDAPHPVRDLADLLRRGGRAAEIAPHLLAALDLRPDDPWAGTAVAEMLLADGHAAAAAEQAADILADTPDFAPAMTLRGAALAQVGQLDEAVCLFEAATQAAPNAAPGWSNLGKALGALGRFAPAITALDRAAVLAPRDLQIRLNRAATLLRAGRLRDGWAAHEARHDLPGRTRVAGARLRPGMNVAGRTVLLWHEEGFGDTLQFIRFAPLLAQRGARVLAWVPRELQRLLAGTPGIDQAVVERPEGYDLHCPVLSLPGVFETTLESVPQQPYLRADPALIEAWRPSLATLGRRVGLVWAGGARPWDPAATSLDRARSMSLDTLAPLGAVPGIELVSLQAGARGADPAPAGMRLQRVLRPGQDFADTAAIVAQLDVVVSVDTAVAHLAGGLGKPVLLLDRFDGCWRWLHGRNRSPWYPNLAILRQGRAGDWSGPVRQAAAMLEVPSGSLPTA